MKPHLPAQYILISITFVMSSKITIHHPDSRSRPNTTPIKLKISGDNGDDLLYHPILRGGVRDDEDIAEISTYLLWGFQNVTNIPKGYYMVGPTYRTDGHIRDTQLSITGKCLVSVPVFNGRLDWRNAYHENSIDAILREMEEEVGLTINPNSLQTLSSRVTVVRAKRHTVTTVLVTGEDIVPYDPSIHTEETFTAFEGHRLIDNRRNKVQIIILLRESELGILDRIRHRRTSNDTQYISGVTAIPTSRLDLRKGLGLFTVNFTGVGSKPVQQRRKRIVDVEKKTEKITTDTGKKRIGTRVNNNTKTMRQRYAKGPSPNKEDSFKARMHRN